MSTLKIYFLLIINFYSFAEAIKKNIMSRRGPKPGTGGRPRVDFDWKLFGKLCEFHGTLTEISSAMGCSEDTVERRVKEKYGVTFQEIYPQLSAPGRLSLRRAQFKTAQSGNATMQIWLGKQLLGQSDKQQIESINLNANANISSEEYKAARRKMLAEDDC